MPVVSITLLPGYGAETEARLVQRVGLAVRSVIAAPAAGTTVFVQHAQTYQRDNRVMAVGGPAVADASALVREFLQRMQDRDLDGARALLAPDFVMNFPGAAPMTHLRAADRVGARALPAGGQALRALRRVLGRWPHGGALLAERCTAPGSTAQASKGFASSTGSRWPTG